MFRVLSFFLVILASSCAGPNNWKLDELAAGNRSFDSSRLKYFNPNHPPSPLEFELLRVGENVEAFVSLKRNHFSGNSSEFVKASFNLGDESYDEEIPLREGAMRVRLSLETAKRLTQALQEGKNVSILIDGYEQILESDRFSRTFSQFLGKRYQDENLFKGPIQ